LKLGTLKEWTGEPPAGKKIAGNPNKTEENALEKGGKRPIGRLSNQTTIRKGK